MLSKNGTNGLWRFLIEIKVIQTLKPKRHELVVYCVLCVIIYYLLYTVCKITIESQVYRKKADPCSMEHLVDSHFILIRLVTETNDVLGSMIGSYFGTQVK